MKKLICIIVLFFFVALSYAQDTSMVYFDSHWVQTTKDKFEYYRKKFKEGNNWDVIDYYKSGIVQMTGSFSNDSCTIRNGAFTWYNNDGKSNHVCNYINDETNGLEILYYGNGNKQMEGINKMGKSDGEWIGYYKSGKIAGKALYKDDEQVSGSFFNEDGTPNKAITVFNRPAEFPGGTNGLIQYLNANLSYPKNAEKNNIQGEVIIQFIVKADGSINEISVAQSVESSLDKEAMRVVKRMPKWTPAIFGGKFSDSFMKQPITFKLQ